MNTCDELSTIVTYPFKEILIGELIEDEEEQNEILINFELALEMFSKHDSKIYMIHQNHFLTTFVSYIKTKTVVK